MRDSMDTLVFYRRVDDGFTGDESWRQNVRGQIEIIEVTNEKNEKTQNKAIHKGGRILETDGVDADEGSSVLYPTQNMHPVSCESESLAVLPRN